MTRTGGRELGYRFIAHLYNAGRTKAELARGNTINQTRRRSYEDSESAKPYECMHPYLIDVGTGREIDGTDALPTSCAVNGNRLYGPVSDLHPQILMYQLPSVQSLMEQVRQLQQP